MHKAACTILFIVLSTHAPPSVAAGGMQSIAVSVTEAGKELTDVPCTLTNKLGSWDLVAPGTASVRRASDELVVTCQKNGISTRHALKSKQNGKWCWSVSKCGGFGFVINDEYPDKANIALRSPENGGAR